MERVLVRAEVDFLLVIVVCAAPVVEKIKSTIQTIQFNLQNII